jgi:hypothetical protein
MNITNDKLDIIEPDQQIKHVFRPKDLEYHKLFSYANHFDVSKVQTYIDLGSHIKINEYTNCPVMYMFIVSLKTIKHTYIITKIGYSDDICQRIKTLKKYYDSDFYLLNIKRITSEAYERKFHTNIRKYYPEFIEKHRIQTSEKEELYRFNDKLYAEFDSVINIPKHSIESVPNHVTQFLNEQSLLFFEYCQNKMAIVDYITKPHHSSKVNIYYIKKHFEYLLERERIQFEREKLEFHKQMTIIKQQFKEKMQKEKQEFEKYKLQHNPFNIEPEPAKTIVKKPKKTTNIIRL